MKKKITYILSLLMIVCMLGACGSDNAEKTYGGYTTDELHTEATDSLSNIQNYIALVDNCGGYDTYEKSVKEVEEKTGMTEGEVVYNTLGQSGRTEMAIGAAYWRKLFRVSSGEDGSEAKL